MRNIDLTITFTDADGAVHSTSEAVKASDPPDSDADHRLAHNILTELKAAVGDHGAQKHNTTAWGWLQFPRQPATLDQYFDIRNSQGVWHELATLVMGAEADLISAQAFKALEPPTEPQFGDERAINDLYYVHDRKINLLNQSVHAVIKVQDLVNRLLPVR